MMQDHFWLGTRLIAAVHIATIGIFTYAIPEHVVDPRWPFHAHHHALQSLMWNIGLNLVSLGFLFSTFQRKERWAWWLLLVTAFLMLGSYFVSGLVTRGGAPGFWDDVLFAGLLAVYGTGLALSWPAFERHPQSEAQRQAISGRAIEQ